LILVDSDVLIANLRGVDTARRWLLDARTTTGPLAISVVSVAEVARVAGGTPSAERREVTRLLSSLRSVPVSDRIAWTAADLMRRYRPSHPGIGLGDYLIAASASVEGLTLRTLNVCHFPMFPTLAPPFSL